MNSPYFIIFTTITSFRPYPAVQPGGNPTHPSPAGGWEGKDASLPHALQPSPSHPARPPFPPIPPQEKGGLDCGVMAGREGLEKVGEGWMARVVERGVPKAWVGSRGRARINFYTYYS